MDTGCCFEVLPFDLRMVVAGYDCGDDGVGGDCGCGGAGGRLFFMRT